MARPFFPFSALVEQNALKTALLLNAVDPTLGGVLIRGYKGTGKTTAVRSLARLLPEIEVVDGCPFNSDPAEPWEFAGVTVAGSQNSRPRATTRRPMPFVELPLNATEDRLVGTLQWERALKGGERYFDPGLLAAANRGLLYVDEVNLLDDHLVDLLLDAAASGVNLVEREGFSLSHPSRFILVGTMNPEEGELRPQFLDRFGLCAIVEHLADPLARELIVRRRLEFEADPDNFCRAWQDQEMALSEQVRQARRRLAAMALDQACLARLTRITHQLEVQGHRADLTICKAARAHAALMDRERMEWADVREAAQLALPHRIAATPSDTPGQLQQRIWRAFAEPDLEGAGALAPEAAEAGEDDWERMAESVQIPGSHAAGSILFEFLKKKIQPQLTKPTSA